MYNYCIYLYRVYTILLVLFVYCCYIFIKLEVSIFFFSFFSSVEYLNSDKHELGTFIRAVHPYRIYKFCTNMIYVFRHLNCHKN